ncbi:MAG: Gmad2 immunoglobulin-like domain-containing protein [Ferruginibacter sp.]
MRTFIIITILFFIGCSEKHKEDQEITNIEKFSENLNNADSIIIGEVKKYSNERFRNVSLTKLANDSFRITGEAQIFEANFSWVIEDGHNELKKGYETTSAGAPEWGLFNFIVGVKKERTNSVLHIILFEISAKDGSRVYELPILL